LESGQLKAGAAFVLGDEAGKTGVAASRQRAALLNLPEKCGGLPRLSQTCGSGREPALISCEISRIMSRLTSAATMKGSFSEVSNGVDWSWPGRIMPAKSGWREGTRFSDFGFSRQKTSNDEVSLAE
jgi:hypothetical protein